MQCTKKNRLKELIELREHLQSRGLALTAKKARELNDLLIGSVNQNTSSNEKQRV